ncbi:hypothetical protein Tco_1125629 [Tanacetum coccineum]|uniref:Uncharacterized protein n=1 Tax=Tanacetum coccineum TaxID=301880 RepID=A0ABQ5JA29_9ASTR
MDLPRDIPLDRIEVLMYDTKGVKVRKGIMQTKTELTLEQTQQGVSDEVLVSIEWVEELKRNVKIKGEKKEVILTLRQKPVIFMDTAYGSSQIRRIGNWSNAFSCEVQALIRRISLVGYDVLVRNQQSSNIFVLAPNYAPFSLSSQNTPELLHLSTLKQLSTKLCNNYIKVGKRGGIMIIK